MRLYAVDALYLYKLERYVLFLQLNETGHKLLFRDKRLKV